MRLLTEADAQMLEQAQIHLRAAFEQLQVHLNERSLSSAELQAVNRQCRRISRLVAASQEFYGGLSNIMSIQTMGYGPAAAKPRLGTGRRFVIEA